LDSRINWNIDLDGVVDELRKKIALNNRALKKLLELPHKTFQNFALVNIMQDERLNGWFFKVSHLDNVKNSPKTRKVMQECLPILSDYQTARSQNEAIYAAYQYILATDYALSDEQKRALELELLSFRLEGVNKPASVKKKIKKINSRLASIENEFSQNVLADTTSFALDITDKKDVEGLPQTDIDAAYVQNKNVWRFTLHAPSYMAYLTYGTNREYREALYKAYSTRGAKNSLIMEEILALRNEKAKLIGYDNYAELSIASKSAPSPKSVEEFLTTLASKSQNGGNSEMQKLKEFGAQQGIADVQSFDIAFLSERLRKESFDIDEEEYRPYFEISKVVAGVFDVCQRLFGVVLKPVKTKLWHPKATAYEVIENDTAIGTLYLDLEARKGKKAGAWMDESASVCVDENGNSNKSEVYVVCNFPPSSKTAPSLLRHSDVETFFHEMGHALHHLLSRATVASVSGVNGVAWDVVEFPSQFFEQFAFEDDALRLFAIHYKTGESLPDILIQKLKKARNFQSAIAMLRQLEFAIFDLKLHQQSYSYDTMQQLLDEVRDAISPLKPPSYNRMQNSFSHIFAGSYAAGYYSYKWAEALSADAYLQYSGLDSALGLKFRNTVLAYGASKPMDTIFKELMGRELDPDALIRLYEI
jgi:oligopeptidase A